MQKTSHITIAAALVLLLVGAWAVHRQATQPDPLTVLDTRATEGAAAGYVDDAVCGRCHVDLYRSYQQVGMAQSFRRPGAAVVKEEFGREYYHEASDRYYQIIERGDGLLFRRYQRADDGGVVNEIEIPVAWIMGSGNRARSYLYQTEWGELYLLPLSWYSEDGTWGMSPGFEAGDHSGIHRKVARKCMFCHNAFPEVPAESDNHWNVETFPHSLPEGTGCQRCHGPGADHVREVLSGADIEDIRQAIVNPARLSPELRDSVCFQCHMLPSASLVGARRLGLGDYSYRPGQRLSEYMVHVDVAEHGVDPADRFEINHHGYRFFQSRCYRESAGKLACISCHDPHVKPESTRFRAAVAEVCAGCHANPAAFHTSTADPTAGDCVSCHMPQRRTSDVVLVTMTDHRIARGPLDHDMLVAPMEKAHHAVTGVGVLDFGAPPSGSEADAYRMMATIRSKRNLRAAERGLERALADLQLPTATPYIDLATAQLELGQFRVAETTARRIIEQDDRLHPAYTVLGIALLAQEQEEEAISMLRHSLELQVDPEAHFNLAAAYLRTGDYDLAEAQIDAALALRPYMHVAWKYKARLHAARDEPELARDALVRVLQLQPLDLPVYGELVDLLRALGEPEEAERYLQVGLRTSRMLGELRERDQQPIMD